MRVRCGIKAAPEVAGPASGELKLPLRRRAGAGWAVRGGEGEARRTCASSSASPRPVRLPADDPLDDFCRRRVSASLRPKLRACICGPGGEGEDAGGSEAAPASVLRSIGLVCTASGSLSSTGLDGLRDGLPRLKMRFSRVVLALDPLSPRDGPALPPGPPARGPRPAEPDEADPLGLDVAVRDSLGEAESARLKRSPPIASDTAERSFSPSSGEVRPSVTAEPESSSSLEPEEGTMAGRASGEAAVGLFRLRRSSEPTTSGGTPRRLGEVMMGIGARRSLFVLGPAAPRARPADVSSGSAIGWRCGEVGADLASRIDAAPPLVAVLDPSSENEPLRSTTASLDAGLGDGEPGGDGSLPSR